MHRLGRRGEVMDAPGGRQEAVRGVLGVNARFQRMAANADVLLRQRQRFARGDAQLPLDQIEAGDHLGHRVLDLQAGVHFHEIKSIGRRATVCDAKARHDELHGASADVADGLGRRHCGSAHGRPPRRRHARRGRLLEHLLMAALHRAVALEQVYDVAKRVGEDLHFDVTRALQVLFDQHLVVAESTPRFALAGGECRGEVCGFFDNAHALAAAAGRGLDQHRVADLAGLLLQQGDVLIVTVIAGHQRHAGLLHQCFGRAL